MPVRNVIGLGMGTVDRSGCGSLAGGARSLRWAEWVGGGASAKLPWGVPRIATLAAPVVTSARRWLERGVWWTTLLNQVIVAGWYLGASPTFLACLYRGSFPFLPLRLPFWTSSD